MASLRVAIGEVMLIPYWVINTYAECAWQVILRGIDHSRKRQGATNGRIR